MAEIKTPQGLVVGLVVEPEKAPEKPKVEVKPVEEKKSTRKK